MRALTISKYGGLDRIELRSDLPIPLPTAGQARVRVTAAALNHLDLFVLGGGLPDKKLDSPWILGADATGVIDEIGPGADAKGLKVGDTVVINPGISDGTCEYCRAGEQSLCVNFGILGEHHPGTIAEYVVVPAGNVRAIPEMIAVESAAAYTLATLTAWRVIRTRAKVRAEDNVLIQGIGGGVAIAALQIAKQIGATVWVTSTSDEKLERARQLGADHLLNSKKVEVGKEIRVQTKKRGVDVVVDSIGRATWKESLIALGRAGRMVCYGASSGPAVETDARRLFWNQWNIMGSTMGNDAEFDAIVEELRAGRLTPPVDSVFPLERGRDAFARLKDAKQFGKIVIRVS